MLTRTQDSFLWSGITMCWWSLSQLQSFFYVSTQQPYERADSHVCFWNATNLFPALLLAGCSSSSPQIPNIFLISMYYESYKPNFDLSQVDPGVVNAISNIVGTAEMEVRVGYFGICVQPDRGSFICNSNATALAEIVTVDQDPLNLIWVASTFKDAVVFPYLLWVDLTIHSSSDCDSHSNNFLIASLLSFSPSSASSSSQHSPAGTRNAMSLALTSRSNLSLPVLSRKQLWPSSLLRRCLSSSPYYGSILPPLQRVLSPKTWVTAVWRAVSELQPWFSVGSASYY